MPRAVGLILFSMAFSAIPVIGTGARAECICPGEPRLAIDIDAHATRLSWQNWIGDLFSIEKTTNLLNEEAWTPVGGIVTGNVSGTTASVLTNSADSDLHLFRTKTLPLSAFVPEDVQVGVSTVNYANVEFTAGGRFMVWLEGETNGSGLGRVWHCAIDPADGSLIPPDGKGFSPFLSSMWGRANPGEDSAGPYYVGMDRSGFLIRVRPLSATTGIVTTLAIPSDSLRRSIYPTFLPDSTNGYLFWMRNAAVPGTTADVNPWFEIQYVDLADPTNVIVVERQNNPPGPTLAPMDIAFARWSRGAPKLTFGSLGAFSKVQSKEVDASTRSTPVFVTDDAHTHIDPFTFRTDDLDYYVCGLDGTDSLGVYTRSTNETMFTLQETIRADATTLTNATLAQSAEPVLIRDCAYVAWQINEAGTNFYDTAFAKGGEIWLSSIGQTVSRQWRVSEASDLARAEPEPCVTSSNLWIFYSATPVGSSLLTTTWQLRRANTPLILR